MDLRRFSHGMHHVFAALVAAEEYHGVLPANHLNARDIFSSEKNSNNNSVAACIEDDKMARNTADGDAVHSGMGLSGGR